jgi:Cd2+/Zn2+-exporting ATPase
MSANRESVYHIQQMDCPTEEKIIRNKLKSINEIVDLRFNLMQRELTVSHTLEDDSKIISALNAIGNGGAEPGQP